MRLHRLWIFLLLLSLATILSGCVEDAIRPVPFVGSLTLFVAILVVVASGLHSLIASQSLTVGASAVISLVLAAGVTLLLLGITDAPSKTESAIRQKFVLLI